MTTVMITVSCGDAFLQIKGGTNHYPKYASNVTKRLEIAILAEDNMESLTVLSKIGI